MVLKYLKHLIWINPFKFSIAVFDYAPQKCFEWSNIVPSVIPNNFSVHPLDVLKFWIDILYFESTISSLNHCSLVNSDYVIPWAWRFKWFRGLWFITLSFFLIFCLSLYFLAWATHVKLISKLLICLMKSMQIQECTTTSIHSRSLS